MKKILSFLLVAIMLCSMFVLPSSAATVNQEVSFQNRENKAAPTVDGVVKTGEYGKSLPFHTYSTSKDQFKDAEHNTHVGEWDVDFYNTWDKNNLYLAWVVKSDSHIYFEKVHYDVNGDPVAGDYDEVVDSNYMWMYSCAQIIITPGAPKKGTTSYQTPNTNTGNYLEIGIAPSSDGSTVRTIWNVPTSIGTIEGVELNKWAAVAKRDDAKGTTTYELSIPWKYCGVEKVGTGAQFGLAYAVASPDAKYGISNKAMMEWQDAILTSKAADNCAVVTLAGGNEEVVQVTGLPEGKVPAAAKNAVQLPFNRTDKEKKDNSIRGEDAILVTNYQADLTAANLLYSANVHLRPVEGKSGIYSVVATTLGGLGTLPAFDLQKGDLIYAAHSDSDTGAGAAARKAAEALVVGTEVAIFGLNKDNTLKYSNAMLYVTAVPEVPDESSVEDSVDESSVEDSVEEPSVAPAESEEESTAAPTDSSAADSTADDDAKEEEGGNLGLWIGIGAGVLVIIAAAVIVILKKKKA